LIYHYSNIPQETFFWTGANKFRRSISIKNLRAVLGDQKSSAILGMHAITGSDVVGKFSGRSKDSAFKIFNSASTTVLDGLAMLGEPGFDVEEDFANLESFICLLYRSPYSTLGQSRWFLFSNKQKQDATLPPTKAAAIQHVLRAHHQTMIWKTATSAFPELVDPSDCGWKVIENQYTPIFTTNPSAPEDILRLAKCSCTKGCKTNRCSCRTEQLVCTDLCGCSLYECSNKIDTYGMEI
jgi:hypothetical protein